MSQQYVTKSAFKAKALEYMRQIEASGESIIITDRGLPTIEVRRYRAIQPLPLERLRGSVVEFKSPVEPVAEDEWEATSGSS